MPWQKRFEVHKGERKRCDEEDLFERSLAVSSSMSFYSYWSDDGEPLD